MEKRALKVAVHDGRQGAVRLFRFPVPDLILDLHRIPRKRIPKSRFRRFVLVHKLAKEAAHFEEQCADE